MTREAPTSEAGEKPAVRRRRSPKGERRRESILAVAAEHFAQGGLDSASLAEIAAKAGLTQAGLLHHFPSKHALLLAVLERRDRPPETGQVDVTGVDFLTGYLDVLSDNENDRHEMQFFAMLSTESIATDHPAHEYFRERQRALTTAMTEALTSIVDTDLLAGSTTVADVADWIVALSDAMRVQWLRDPASVDRTESIFRLLETLAPAMHPPARDALLTHIQQRREDAS